MNDAESRTVSEAYDSVADIYDASFSSKLLRADNQALFWWLSRLKCSKGVVVDLGCGTGLALDYLRISPRNYVGIDISAGMLGKARAKHPKHQFFRRDMCDTHIPDEWADVVISTFGGFSYIPFPTNAVREIKRILKPGGRFFVMAYGEPAQESPDIVEETGPELPNIFYAPETLEMTFGHLFDQVRVRGFGHARRTTPSYLTPLQMSGYVTLETEFPCRWNPEQCNYVVAIGRKNA